MIHKFMVYGSLTSSKMISDKKSEQTDGRADRRQ